jgi:GT2 family glycosyltransferase
MKIAVLLTVHNRLPRTLNLLSNLFTQIGLADDTHISVYLVNDGSTDNTAAMIETLYPEVNLINGTGDLYWNGGMRLAYANASLNDYDYYFWLNNDVTLFNDSLSKLLNVSISLGDKSIIIGSLQDPETKTITYGGVSRLTRWKRLHFTLIAPEVKPIKVETMNGNCVLIPRIVAHNVGNLDPLFTHAIGDYDYGLRARKLGFLVYLAPGYYGYCQRNKLRKQWNNPSLPLKTRWNNLVSHHGLPPREWRIFAYRYGGPFWWLYWMSPYIKTIFSAFLKVFIRRRNNQSLNNLDEFE